MAKLEQRRKYVAIFGIKGGSWYDYSEALDSKKEAENWIEIKREWLKKQGEIHQAQNNARIVSLTQARKEGAIWKDE